MAEWSKAVDLRPTINDARVRTPLRSFIFFYRLYKKIIKI